MIAGYITQQALVKKYGQKGISNPAGTAVPGPDPRSGCWASSLSPWPSKAKAIAGSPQLLLLYVLGTIGDYLRPEFFNQYRGGQTVSAAQRCHRAWSMVRSCATCPLPWPLPLTPSAPKGPVRHLVVAMAYIIQVQSAAWYVKYADAIFGKPDAGKMHGRSNRHVRSARRLASSRRLPLGGDAHSAGAQPLKKFFTLRICRKPPATRCAMPAVMGSKFGAEVQVLHVVTGSCRGCMLRKPASG